MEDKKRKYSNLQKAFWVVSGNEVWIIKECTTTYNYYTSQGLILFMTFLFASFCGAFAGTAFGNNWAITLLFGLIWGFLVYSIDRMMVQSIDKVHVEQLTVKKKFWVYFFPRLFLGILLAIFMSSPLDHYLFKEQIADQMQKNADATWMQYQNDLKSAMDLSGTENRQKDYKSDRDSLNIAKGKNPNTASFKEAKANYDREFPKLKPLETEKNNNNYEKNLAWNQIPTYYDTIKHENVKIRTSNEYQTYLVKRREYDNSVTAYNSKYTEIKNYQSIMADEIRKYEEELSTKIAKHDTIIDKLTNKIESINDTIDNKIQTKQDFLGKLQGFDTKFMTLLTHPDFGVQFLRWFIFLVFLMIEILPTWMKLMGKPTEYDLKLHQYKLKQVKAIEQSINQDDELFEIKKQSELELAVEKEKQRREIELENHKKILNNIAEKQNSISIAILDEWEEKVKNNSKVDDFVNKTN